MIARLIYMEPELWNIFERLGKLCKPKKTRSTYIRCELKDANRSLNKISGIDWLESNRK